MPRTIRCAFGNFFIATVCGNCRLLVANLERSTIISSLHAATTYLAKSSMPAIEIARITVCSPHPG
jgi:hypothetical protein